MHVNGNEIQSPNLVIENDPTNLRMCDLLIASVNYLQSCIFSAETNYNRSIILSPLFAVIECFSELIDLLVDFFVVLLSPY